MRSARIGSMILGSALVAAAAITGHVITYEPHVYDEPPTTPKKRRREPRPPHYWQSWRESQKPLTRRQKRRLRGKGRAK